MFLRSLATPLSGSRKDVVQSLNNAERFITEALSQNRLVETKLSSCIWKERGIDWLKRLNGITTLCASELRAAHQAFLVLQHTQSRSARIIHDDPENFSDQPNFILKHRLSPKFQVALGGEHFFEVHTQARETILRCALKSLKSHLKFRKIDHRKLRQHVESYLPNL